MRFKSNNRRLTLVAVLVGTAFSAMLVTAPRALAGPNENVPPALASVHELMDHQQYEEALPILSGLIGRNSEGNEVYALRGVCYSRLEEFERAVRDFREYFKTAKEPAPLAYHRLYGLSLCQFQKFPEALEQFNIDIKREPKIWDYWFDRTQLYTVTKKYDKALSDANVMVSLKPDHFRYALRARIYAAMGNYEKSAQDWTIAIKESGDRHDYYAERAKCYDKMGKADLAAKDRQKRDAGLD